MLRITNLVCKRCKVEEELASTSVGCESGNVMEIASDEWICQSKEVNTVVVSYTCADGKP